MTIEALVQQWIQDTIGSPTPVIRADQNAPVPDSSFVTYKAIAYLDDENPHTTAPDDTGVATVSFNRLITISLNSYGEDARDNLLLVRDDLERITRLDVLRAEGLAFVRIANGIQDVTAVIGTQYEERYNMDIIFRITNNILDDQGIIETVIGTGTIDEVDYNYEIGV